LFQSPFTKFDDPNHLNPNSSGMGLYICHQLVKAMDGKIKVRRDGRGCGSGSCFVFAVPYIKAHFVRRGSSSGNLTIHRSNHVDSQMLLLDMMNNRAVFMDEISESEVSQ